MAEIGAKKWMITITVILCSMLELIDVSIVNVALTDMMGNLGATLSEVSWVVAAYAIANVIVIPMADFLSETFGRRTYFIGSVMLFTAASVCCGLSTSIWMLVFFRFIQGMAGGALLTTSQTILVEAFPEEQLGLANGLFGMGVVIGPTIGPTLGGVIVDNLSWHWIFFINLPVGIIASLLAITFIKNKKSATTKDGKKTIDWVGILMLIIGVGSLQLVLEKGNDKDWFQSIFIISFAFVAAFGIIGFIWRMLSQENPIVDLKVLKNRNVAVGTFLSFILGFGLFGSVFIYPVFAQQILGYTATLTGELLIPGALLGGLMMPLVGKLIQKGVSAKVLVPMGFAIFGIFCFWTSQIIAPDTTERAFFFPLFTRGLGMSFLFLPLSILSLQGLKGRDVGQSAGINNMMRQLGGSFGIAILATYLGNKTVANRAILDSHLNHNDPNVIERLNQMTISLVAKGMNALQAKQQALAIFEGMLTKQVYLVTYVDVFMMLGAFFFICIPIIFLAKTGKKKETAQNIPMH